MNNHLPKQFANNWLKESGYFLLFIGCYLTLNYLYLQIPADVFVDIIYNKGIVLVCANVLNLIFPVEQVQAIHNHLYSTKANLEIVRGCDGAGMFFLLISAIAVFPAQLTKKLTGLLLGVSLLYILNLLRICLIYFVMAYQPAWFSLVHIYLAPTLLIIVGCTYFAWWAFVANTQ